MTSATRLYATHWTFFLERVQYLAFLSTALSLALGYSQFSPRTTRWLSFAYTLFAVPWQLGSTLVDSSFSWNERLWILGSRAGVAVSDIVNKRTVHDPILFLSLMALLFWLIGLIGGYYLVRHGQIWPGVLSAGVTLLIVDHYDPTLVTWARYVGIFLFATLMLLGRTTYLRYRAEWQTTGLVQSPGISGDVSRAALMAVVVVVLFAWTVPAIGQSVSSVSQLWLKVSKPFDTVRSRVSDAFSSLQSSVGVVSDFYGGNMPLGTGTHLGNQIVFSVKASAMPPQGMRYYWRARSYDVYQDGSWSSSNTDTRQIPANGPNIPYPKWKDRQEITFTFTSNVTLQSTMYTSSTPLKVSRAGTATVLKAPDGTVDVSVINNTAPLNGGDSYTETGWIAVPPVPDLVAAGTDYPAYIKDRYLQLPGNLSPRFADLAKSLTNGLPDPYDKAQTITQYLRQTISYSETVPNPPQGQDPIEWFLFDLKKGYCNYYATAEVLLLREVGIPARLSVGFAQGAAINPQGVLPGEGAVTDNYAVRFKDSHAWPEVFFPGIGWVEFEPTVIQPNLVLPLAGSDSQDTLSGRFSKQPNGSIQDANKNSDPALNAVKSAGSFVSRVFQPAPVRVVFGLVMLGLLWMILRTGRIQKSIPLFPVWLEGRISRRGWRVPGWLRRWSRWSLFSALERAYGSINQGLSLVGHPAKPSETPAERSEALGTWLPRTAEPAAVILAEYQRALYSRQPGNGEIAQSASQVVRSESWKAFARRILRLKR